MREIKFRGRRIDGGDWVYGWLIGDKRTFIISNFIVDLRNNKGEKLPNVNLSDICEVDPKTVGQYTNIKIAGGDELYDGDIFEDDTDWFKVEWSKEDGAWYAFGIRDRGGNIDMQLSEFSNCSTSWKQGNIYENPELLTHKPI